MSTGESQRQAFAVWPPTQSTTPGTGVTWLQTSTTAAAFDLSAIRGMFGRRIRLYASGGKIWVSTGGAATPVIDKSFVGGATIAAGTKQENPIPLLADTSIEIRLDSSANKFLHVQADSGTPILIIYSTSEPRMSDQPL